MKLIVGIGSKKKVDNFCHILSSLKHMTDHIILHFDESGLYSQGLGSDHISLYEFKFNNDWFDLYEFNETDRKIICLNAGIIQKIFATRQEKQLVTISYDDKSDKIDVSFRSKVPSKSDFPKDFQVTLMDIEDETMDIPTCDYTAEFGITTKIFNSIVDQLEIFNEQIQVTCSEEKIEFTASGIEGSLSINLFNDKVDYVTEYAVAEDTILNLVFSNRHFQNFCKFSKISKEVKLYFSEAYPMQMLYALDAQDEDAEDVDVISNKSYIRFCLAPKIEDDD